LVARDKGEKDRRQVYVSLTARGEAVLENLSAAHKKQLRRVGPQIEAILARLRR
jgi:DNA-binding MarR family transcriptional regulator